MRERRICIWLFLGYLLLFSPIHSFSQIDPVKSDSTRDISDTLSLDSLEKKILLFGDSTAQTTTIDTTITINDTTVVIKKGFVPELKRILISPPRPPFDPQLAWKKSLIFPGWGQFYNKSYWKIPIVYGGYVGFGLYIDFNNKQYNNFRQAYTERVNDITEDDFNTFPSQVPTDGIRKARDSARRQRDYAILFIAGYHLLQVVEAFVDAHLKNFDVSEDLSMKTYPSAIQHQIATGAQFTYPGITLSFGF